MTVLFLKVCGPHYIYSTLYNMLLNILMTSLREKIRLAICDTSVCLAYML